MNLSLEDLNPDLWPLTSTYICEVTIALRICGGLRSKLFVRLCIKLCKYNV